MTDREKRNPDSRGEGGRRVVIGVLALQGDFAMHEAALARVAGVSTRQVRKPEDLEGLDGLVVPGGESTTLLKLMDAWGFVPALEKFHAAGRPIFGTCAGLILLARDVDRPKQSSLGLIDVGVERNAYGRQRESFVAQGATHLEGRTRPLEMVFIRAPRITRLGSDVQPLATHAEDTVMARQGTVLVATFHPELTTDPAVHEYFCRMVASAKGT